MKISKFILIIIILIAVVLRFYQLDKIPPGLNIDEASEGYNAFSLLHTGKDRYGETLPIMFRSFGSFQAPLYTYFSIIPVYFFGNSIFSIHFISAVSGVLLVIITLVFLLIQSGGKEKTTLAGITGLMVAISPWAIFFSRIGTEASLGLTLFASSFLLFYLSLRNFWFFLPATFILGLSTHAYYSERLISVLFLAGFLLLFRKRILTAKKIIFLGLIIFFLTQIPHLMIINSGAFTRRISQVDYYNDQFFQNNGGSLHAVPFGKSLFIVREFFSQYLAYFSPKNLFFDPDPQEARSMPDLSVFYSWMIVPFFLGIRRLLIKRSEQEKMIILLLLIAPIPASLTRDPFSTIRTLVFLWTMTIVIGLGFYRLKMLLLFTIIFFSLFQLYIAYFVLLKNERSENYGYSHLKLLKQIENIKDKKIVVDSSRELGTGIRFAYMKKYDPKLLQKILSSQIKGQYYSNFEFDEPYALDNIEVRPIFWKKDICTDLILIGDLLSISEGQVKEHKLTYLFDVKNMAGEVTIKAYQTNPDLKCGINAI